MSLPFARRVLQPHRDHEACAPIGATATSFHAGVWSSRRGHRFIYAPLLSFRAGRRRVRPAASAASRLRCARHTATLTLLSRPPPRSRGQAPCYLLILLTLLACFRPFWSRKARWREVNSLAEERRKKMASAHGRSPPGSASSVRFWGSSRQCRLLQEYRNR